MQGGAGWALWSKVKILVPTMETAARMQALLTGTLPWLLRFPGERAL